MSPLGMSISLRLAVPTAAARPVLPRRTTPNVACSLAPLPAGAASAMRTTQLR
jgi:hypothetical protein